MIEAVYNVPSYAVMEALAQQLGWWIPDENGGGKIQTNGIIHGGVGNYQLNHVGTVYTPTGNTVDGPLGPVPEMTALPGEWGRLRLNGESNFLDLIPAGAPITIYHYYPPVDQTPGYWSADGGVTPAPDYVATIGMIA